MSSLNLNSFAGILSDDTRYETFEGNNITINDILEEDKVDVEIEGNSFVNVFDYSKLEKLSDIPNSYGFSINDREITRDYTSVQGIEPATYLKTTEEIIKKGETYTFVIDITNNTLDERIEFYPYLWKYAEWFKGDNYIQPSYIGKAIVSFKAMTDARVKLLYAHYYPTYTGSISITDIMLLKGDYYDEFTNNPSSIPEYFEGIKSVGELEDGIKIKASNKNLFNPITLNLNTASYNYNNAYIKSYENGIITVSSKNTLTNNYESYTNPRHCIIKLKPNTSYYFSYKTDGVYSKTNNTDTVEIFLAHMHPNLKDYTLISSVEPSGIKFTTDSLGMLGVRFDINDGLTEHIFYDIQIEEDLNGSEYTPYEETNYLINLNQPLRGLPNGIKDRVIKRNGQWVIERNVGRAVIDGSENWFLTTSDNGIRFFEEHNGLNKKHYHKPSALKLLSDKLLNKKIYYAMSNNEYEDFIITTDLYGSHEWRIATTQDMTLDEFKEWLSINKPKVIYELETPIYEPLNIDSTINLYLNTTHVSNSSTIPANIKITVDRTINRAVEAIELAKTNPTVENLSKARIWTNLLKESIKKDELQEEINNITNIEGLEIEKKNITSNMDVYIKPENSLSMTLSTNSIVFDDFSGVENMEKLNAVDITISSSLPYQLNSYLESEIKNSDGSKIIPKELLNIRLNGENDYKAFSNINEKLVLKENCLKGNDNQFSIDLILKGDLTHRADIYKTVIKFEVEQK